MKKNEKLSLTLKKASSAVNLETTSPVMNVFNVFIAELKRIYRDNGVFLIMVGGVCLYGFFYMIPFCNHIARNVPIGIIDNDNSELSRKLIRNFQANEMLDVKTRPRDLDEAEKQYYKQRICAFVVIPKDFEKNIKQGKKCFLTLYSDSAFMIIYKQVASGVQTVVSRVGTALVINRLMKEGVNKKLASSITAPFDFVSEPLYNPAGSYQNYIYPLALIMILQQTMLIGVSMLGGTLVEQIRGMKYRKNGRSDEPCRFAKLGHLNQYSSKNWEIVLGKSFAYVLLYLVYGIVYLSIFPAFVVYHMSYNWWSMLAILLPFLFATAFLGQAMAVFCKRREDSLFILIVSSVPFIFLPGFVWPKEAIPLFVNWIAKIVPTTSAIDGLVKINQMGASFQYVREDFLTLILLCVVYFLGAVMVYRKFNPRFIRDSR